jgi:hypothetical protein
LRRSNSMSDVHNNRTGVTSAVRISIKTAHDPAQVFRTGAYTNFGERISKEMGRTRVHSDYTTIADPDKGKTVNTPIGKARKATSIAETTQEYGISKKDAEVYSTAAAFDLFAKHLLEFKGKGPLEVEVEYHGNEGPCGLADTDGCKGRLLQTSESLKTELMKAAPRGSSFVATSVYSKESQEKTRKEIPTRYGYETKRVAEQHYGSDEESYVVQTHEILKADNKPPTFTARKATPIFSFANAARAAQEKK